MCECADFTRLSLVSAPRRPSSASPSSRLMSAAASSSSAVAAKSNSQFTGGRRCSSNDCTEASDQVETIASRQNRCEETCRLCDSRCFCRACGWSGCGQLSSDMCFCRPGSRPIQNRGCDACNSVAEEHTAASESKASLLSEEEAEGQTTRPRSEGSFLPTLCVHLARLSNVRTRLCTSSIDTRSNPSSRSPHCQSSTR